MPISTLGLREQGPHLSCGRHLDPRDSSFGISFLGPQQSVWGASGIGNRKSGGLTLSLRQ